MRELDDTDLEILQLLQSNARRPYSEIAEAVDLSAPAVSDRVARLREMGVINRFTLDIDRSKLRKGIPVLITLTLSRGNLDVTSVKETLLETGEVEYVYTTAEAELVVYAQVSDGDVTGWLTTVVDEGTIEDIEVKLLTAADWSPDLAGTEFALACAQCGNTVDSEGTATHIDGDLYQFCCPSCEERFTDRYEEHRQEAA